MITKADLLERARKQDLRATTVEKDYVLGWLLAAVSSHQRLSLWVFKGGTCLKKCFFETYRFSEDLDFTVPKQVELTADGIHADLVEIGSWMEQETGIALPPGKVKVERYLNKRGKEAFQAKVAYVCRLNLAPNSLQKVKFDITQDEWLATPSDMRPVSHPYEDAIDPPTMVRCYSVEEILAEKTRALCERAGRARDVYDLVHLSREFRDSIDAIRATEIAQSKFAFKGLSAPRVDQIVSAIDQDVLRANWTGQLQHQLPALPPVEGFLEDLPDAIAWWLEPQSARPAPPLVPGAGDPVRVADLSLGTLTDVDRPSSGTIHGYPGGIGPLARIRFAARNRVCAEIIYKGSTRQIEPYSLRRSSPGKIRLFGYEQSKNGTRVGQMKSYFIDQIQSAKVTGTPFQARYRVEL